MIKKIFNFQFSIFNSAKQRGFTILESIVAIGILSAAIAGVFSAIQANLSQSIIVKDEVKAFYLAQEAVEIIRNMRDNNQLERIADPSSSITWLDGIAESGNPCSFDKTCRADATGPGNVYLFYCGDTWNSCENLRQNQTTFVYGYGYDSNWKETNFKREIQIERVNDTEIAVTVRVSWKKGIIDKKFEAKTHLLNWI